MNWTCPICGKQFRNTNQYHSCYVTDLEKHFKNKPEKVKLLFEKIWQPLESLEGTSLNSVKTSIQIRAGATFLSVTPKKGHLEIQFQLSETFEEFPIYRTVKISGKRVLHFAIIEEPEDITEKLTEMFKKSYELVYRPN